MKKLSYQLLGRIIHVRILLVDSDSLLTNHRNRTPCARSTSCWEKKFPEIQGSMGRQPWKPAALLERPQKSIGFDGLGRSLIHHRECGLILHHSTFAAEFLDWQSFRPILRNHRKRWIRGFFRVKTRRRR